jgi:hypothetical protein
VSKKRISSQFSDALEPTIPKTTFSITASTTMKSPSQAQSTGIYTASFSNSIPQSVSINADSQAAFPTTTTNTSSPESQAVKRQRLRMIIESAITLIDDDDFNPDELCMLSQRPRQ